MQDTGRGQPMIQWRDCKNWRVTLPFWCDIVAAGEENWAVHLPALQKEGKEREEERKREGKRGGGIERGEHGSIRNPVVVLERSRKTWGFARSLLWTCIAPAFAR